VYIPEEQLRYALLVVERTSIAKKKADLELPVVKTYYPHRSGGFSVEKTSARHFVLSYDKIKDLILFPSSLYGKRKKKSQEAE
jgi:hypothetical protein